MQGAKVLMATAMCVFSRLSLWGAVSAHCDRALIEQIIQHVRAAAQLHLPTLFAMDGLRSCVSVILNVFRVVLDYLLCPSNNSCQNLSATPISP